MRPAPHIISTSEMETLSPPFSVQISHSRGACRGTPGLQTLHLNTAQTWIFTDADSEAFRYAPDLRLDDARNVVVAVLRDGNQYAVQVGEELSDARHGCGGVVGCKTNARAE